MASLILNTNCHRTSFSLRIASGCLLSIAFNVFMRSSGVAHTSVRNPAPLTHGVIPHSVQMDLSRGGSVPYNEINGLDISQGPQPLFGQSIGSVWALCKLRQICRVDTSEVCLVEPRIMWHSTTSEASQAPCASKPPWRGRINTRKPQSQSQYKQVQSISE